VLRLIGIAFGPEKLLVFSTEGKLVTTIRTNEGLALKKYLDDLLS
jgi:hypothetical protein